ncbi:MAG TPA: ATP-grasp domain-containing protein [Casimicrobiaceae bacterium]
MFIVLHDAWRLHPLTWIHRGEARRIACELRRNGHAVRRAAFGRSSFAESRGGRHILRLCDPVMFEAVEALSSTGVPYIGPGFEAMKRCYDKYAATRLLAAGGFTCPETALGTEADRIDFPVVLKPRWGSDSIGVRRYERGPVPARKRNERYIVQRHVRGADITVGVLNGEAGFPLHIRIPDGTLYTFARKYVLRPRIEPLAEQPFATRVRVEAARIAAALGVDWAARVDFIHERAGDLLYFLECDVAPLVGPGSAFDTSLRAAGLTRSEQLERLFLRDDRCRSRRSTA